MKRQRGSPRKTSTARTTTKVTKKKAKRPEAVKSAKEAAEEPKVAEEGSPRTEEVAELASLWSGVDEEMPWATRWIPFWEMDAYDALYGDVLWDYDIWDLNHANP